MLGGNRVGNRKSVAKSNPQDEARREVILCTFAASTLASCVSLGVLCVERVDFSIYTEV